MTLLLCVNYMYYFVDVHVHVYVCKFFKMWNDRYRGIFYFGSCHFSWGEGGGGVVIKLFRIFVDYVRM